MTARAFIKSRFRALADVDSQQDHWVGGKPHSDDAICPHCKIPLLLLWDINCRDARFPKGKFGALKRLPLYFCWSCVSDLVYQCQPDGGLRIYPSPQVGVPNSPQYEPFPQDFPRKPLSLVEGVPDELRVALRTWDMDDDAFANNLSKESRAIIEAFFGHAVFAPFTLYHSQFGGDPIKREWGEEPMRCPNKNCRPTSLFRFAATREMSFLAGVLNDPRGGLPMVEQAKDVTNNNWNYLVDVEFQICNKCLTIGARNRAS